MKEDLFFSVLSLLSLSLSLFRFAFHIIFSWCECFTKKQQCVNKKQEKDTNKQQCAVFKFSFSFVHLHLHFFAFLASAASASSAALFCCFPNIEKIVGCFGSGCHLWCLRLDCGMGS